MKIGIFSKWMDGKIQKRSKRHPPLDKGFKSEKQKLALNVLFTAGWLDCMAMRRFKPHGISPQQFNVLRILRGQSPKAVSANLIAGRMIDRKSNVSRLIDKLLLKGLVTRVENPDDRRAIQVSITTKGLHLLAKLDKEEPKWLETMSQISEKDAKHANAVLDCLRKESILRTGMLSGKLVRK